MDEYHSPRIAHAVRSHTDSVLEDVLWKIEQKEVHDVEDCYDVVSEYYYDETAAIELDLDERLTVLEYHAEDYGLALGDVSLGDIRGTIETLASVVICYLGEGDARSLLEELASFMDEHDLSFEQLVTAQSFGWACHYAERSVGECCQVYEYRNVEGEIHVDVWEYRLTEHLKVYFEVFLHADDVSVTECLFDAT